MDDSNENTSSNAGEETPAFTSLYFAYSSNLSPRTMKQRCPDSLYVGLARLDNWKWIINETGFANVIPSEGDIVYGSLYFISRRDESALDVSEGFSWWNEKTTVSLMRLPSGVDGEGQKVDALAYIDVQRKVEATIDRDYGVWINRAIEDGIASGIPASYMNKYLRPALSTNKEIINDIEMIRTTLGALAPDAQKIFASGKFHPGGSGGS